MRKYVSLGMKRDDCLSLANLTKHAYYYRPKGRENAGIKASNETLFYLSEDQVFIKVPNSRVMDEIVFALLDPDMNYGYKAMTAHLQLRGYVINHKKVYRLMEENNLLQDARKKSTKIYVKYRRVFPNGPLEVLEMDIKLQWVTEQERYAYILNIIDCFTRKLLYQKVALSIKHPQVKEAWEYIIVNYLQENDMLNKKITIEVRNDNDKRFEAQAIKDFFQENYLNQVFTKPYTPQENGHIESFHAILSRSLDTQYYSNLKELETRLSTFKETYNKRRVHGSLNHLPPDIFWALWKKDLIEKIQLENKYYRFKLKGARHQLTGNESLRELSVPVCA